MRNANQILQGDGAAAAADARKAMAEMNELLAALNVLVEENRVPLNAMTTDGFGEFRRLMAETRILVSSMARVAQRLEDNPSAVLFGNRDAEYRNEGGVDVDEQHHETQPAAGGSRFAPVSLRRRSPAGTAVEHL